ncbi:hypothetical protein B0A50_07519 [Salinomyces thailandicus]|uniref:ethanolamine-phosphate cytidylyltransferase n=1 Tax=Salinomyces thailandicus TaxID=706561 RepID=A0A4U0TNY9_9PEZI|nr:hypothetical protein B0A50_07519 [Salinomyces thailandica]
MSSSTAPLPDSSASTSTSTTTTTTTTLPLSENRIWIDGCFDFFHHGHAGVILQSRRLGTELLVGLHSDPDIAANKGPTVMNLAERVAAVDASRWSTQCIPHAPYVTSLEYIGRYGCMYVAHGDDITSDADGQDCYRYVKEARRMKIVPRTPGISTTDLVGRMLRGGTEHFVQSLPACLEGGEGVGEGNGKEMNRRIHEYAAAANGLDPWVNVYCYQDNLEPPFRHLVPGLGPRPGQRIVYVDGAFDLFSAGHIGFLRAVTTHETSLAPQSQPQQQQQQDSPFYLILGLHPDHAVNAVKGGPYPIMNLFERALCAIQARFVHAVVLAAPTRPTNAYFASLPPLQAAGKPLPDAVYHGAPRHPSSPASSLDERYADAKAAGIFTEISPPPEFRDVDAAQIVSRILGRRAEYEERERRKGGKSLAEGVLKSGEMGRGKSG